MPCENTATTGLAVGVVILVFGFVLFGTKQGRNLLTAHIPILKYMDTGKLKVLWSTMQIVARWVRESRARRRRRETCRHHHYHYHRHQHHQRH